MTDEEYIEDAADFGYFQEDEDFDNDEFFDKNCLLELTKDYFQKFYLLILKFLPRISYFQSSHVK